jgi:hypothetical protein
MVQWVHWRRHRQGPAVKPRPPGEGEEVGAGYLHHGRWAPSSQEWEVALRPPVAPPARLRGGRGGGAPVQIRAWNLDLTGDDHIDLGQPSSMAPSSCWEKQGLCSHGVAPPLPGESALLLSSSGLCQWVGLGFLVLLTDMAFREKRRSDSMTRGPTERWQQGWLTWRHVWKPTKGIN